MGSQHRWPCWLFWQPAISTFACGNKVLFCSRWMIVSAMTFAWLAGIAYNMALVFTTSAVVDGVCYSYVFWKSQVAALVHRIWNFATFVVVVVWIFIFCYGRILIVIRRQASVMARHGGTQCRFYSTGTRLSKRPKLKLRLKIFLRKTSEKLGRINS